MKISKETLTILKNFQLINPSIYIEEGNTILTKSPASTVIGKALVSDAFPKSFAIYELARFLSVASMMKEAEIHFDDLFLTFNEGNKKIRYGYCDPEVIVYPLKKPVKFPKDEIYGEFFLSSLMLKETLSAMNVLGHEGIVIRGEDGLLKLTSYSTSSNDLFSMEIGEIDKTFSLIIEASKLNLIQKDYDVTISKKKFVRLSSENLEYYIAPDIKSEMY